MDVDPGAGGGSGCSRETQRRLPGGLQAPTRFSWRVCASPTVEGLLPLPLALAGSAPLPTAVLGLVGWQRGVGALGGRTSQGPRLGTLRLQLCLGLRQGLSVAPA